MASAALYDLICPAAGTTSNPISFLHVRLGGCLLACLLIRPIISPFYAAPHSHFVRSKYFSIKAEAREGRVAVALPNCFICVDKRRDKPVVTL